MGSFLERLKQKRSEQDDLDNKRLQWEKEQREIHAQRDKSEREELIRIQKLREQALSTSPVPRMAEELARAIDNIPGTFIKSGGSEIHISVGYASRFGTTYNKVILIQGIEDGSVIIGQSVLPREDALDPERVDNALEKAFRNPTRVKSSKYHTGSSYAEDTPYGDA